MARLHVIGAPGAGKSSLARALAERTGLPHVESDDLFWAPTDPPYRWSRPADERAALIAERLPPDGAWVLSGTLPIPDAPPFAGVTQTFRLALAAPDRLARLRSREAARFGARIAPGGEMHATHAAFLDWAAAFDEAAVDQACEGALVMRLDARLPVATLMESALRELESRR